MKAKEVLNLLDKDTILNVLAAVATFFIIRTLDRVDDSLKTTALSVQELNKTVTAAVVEISYQKQGLNDQKIIVENLDSRVRVLESVRK